MTFRTLTATLHRASLPMATALLIGFAAGNGAAAADLGFRDRSTPAFAHVDPGTWIVTLSGNVVVTPRYPGAEDYTVIGYPGVDIRRVGEPKRFSTPDDGFSFSIFDSDMFRVGPTARFVPGRYYGDDRAHLFGLRDARFAVEPGIFAEFYPVPFIRTRIEARHGVYGHHGFVGSLAADYLLPVDRWLFSLGPRFNAGDASFARKYFGVTPDEAVLNGRLTAYRPDDFFSAGLLGAVTYTQDATWAYTAYAGYTHIIGDAADSPLVRRPFGDPNQFLFGVKIDYSFTTPAWF